jgi:hypothetical protein
MIFCIELPFLQIRPGSGSGTLIQGVKKYRISDANPIYYWYR